MNGSNLSLELCCLLNTKYICSSVYDMNVENIAIGIFTCLSMSVPCASGECMKVQCGLEYES